MNPPREPTHGDSARAASFGAVAESYDRFRPSYPPEVIDDLVALAPGRVLDVGCGTGKLAVQLGDRGLAVLGVEVDEGMADVARRHGIDVEVDAFETWPARGRRFDLVTCAQAWHWIDPVAGPAKAAELLTAGGTLVLLWNHDAVDGPVRDAFDEVYRRHAPDLAPTMTPSQLDEDRHDLAPLVATITRSGAFAEIETRQYLWERIHTADEWVGRMATHSDHLTLPPDARASLLAGVHSAIGATGGAVHVQGVTFVLMARPAAS